MTVSSAAKGRMGYAAPAPINGVQCFSLILVINVCFSNPRARVGRDQLGRLRIESSAASAIYSGLAQEVCPDEEQIPITSRLLSFPSGFSAVHVWHDNRHADRPDWLGDSGRARDRDQ